MQEGFSANVWVHHGSYRLNGGGVQNHCSKKKQTNNMAQHAVSARTGVKERECQGGEESEGDSFSRWGASAPKIQFAKTHEGSRKSCCSAVSWRASLTSGSNSVWSHCCITPQPACLPACLSSCCQCRGSPGEQRAQRQKAERRLHAALALCWLHSAAMHGSRRRLRLRRTRRSDS